ncbi:TetR/AcrR family transcriptional regulator [Mycolicibacterium hodleri]|uniref:TetR/AcrR family transcriptional regulator n=1 Tax=Mycolicibacterium hodleri TaxID=49897 RepID=A0A502EJQ4_9MYCO|nr:TetR/AcrR family transcriptional regulator [Mycolicibacterium hodleri]TPG37344.1 TetR/AcrR family transcriptional regulator [Mycolicibacterium hodleri]
MSETTASSKPDRQGHDELSTVERIRRAALASFALHGTAATTLRAVATAAGVSLGLVQHHFATKAGLIKAVDDYVLALVIAQMSQPVPDLPADSVADIGSRVTRIIAEEPDAAGYIGRALVDGSPLGTTLFDALMDVGMTRWRHRAERGETRADIDLTWAVINGLVLALGAVSLRVHVDRHLPQPFTTPAQLQRWQNATDSLLRDGLFIPPVGE